jgi:VWFA-related protein
MNVSAQLRPALALACLVLASAVARAAPQAKAEQDEPYKIQVDVNRVLVPVVVRDKQGRAVGDLKQEDFQVFADGKPLPVSAFAIEKHALPASNAQAAAPDVPAPTNVPAPPSPASQRFVIFLFDDMHLSIEDLSRAQKAGAKVLAGSLSEKDIADVISLSGKTDSGLTRDRARLQDAILSLRTNSLYHHDGGDCPNIDYYQADQMENKHSEVALQAAIQQVFSCSPGMDRQRDMATAERLADSAAMRALSIGQQDTQATYLTIQNLVSRIALLPGQRMLILVSPGFLSINSESMAAESHIIQIAAQSNVVINSLDARGLYTTEMDASFRSSGSANTDRLSSEYRRSVASQSEGAMSAFAAGTGGTFFHNSNDLAGGLASLTAAPEYLYMLEVSPRQAKPDGSYHRLKVKVNRDGLQLQARLGYFEPKPEKNKK